MDSRPYIILIIYLHPGCHALNALQLLADFLNYVTRTGCRTICVKQSSEDIGGREKETRRNIHSIFEFNSNKVILVKNPSNINLQDSIKIEFLRNQTTYLLGGLNNVWTQICPTMHNKYLSSILVIGLSIVIESSFSLYDPTNKPS